MKRLPHRAAETPTTEGHDMTTDHTAEAPTTTGLIDLTAIELVEHIAAIRAGKGNRDTHRAMAWECLDYLTRGL